MFRSPLTDAILVIVVLLLIVGPKKLPQLGRGLGDGMREFKEGITGDHKHDASSQTLSEAPPTPTATQAQAPPAAQAPAPQQPAQPAASPSGEAGADRS